MSGRDTHNQRGLLGRLETLHQEATPGPWWPVMNDLIGGWQVATIDLPASEIDYRENASLADFANEKDAALIAEMRNALPALLAVARAAQGVRHAMFPDNPQSWTVQESRLAAALALLEQAEEPG